MMNTPCPRKHFGTILIIVVTAAFLSIAVLTYLSYEPTTETIFRNRYSDNIDESDGHNDDDMCTDSNWLNEMYSLFEPMDLNSFKTFERINYTTFKQTYNDINQPIILMNYDNSDDINTILDIFEKLSFYSMYIHRVNNKNDIKIVQRLQELTNDRCCDKNWGIVKNYKRLHVFNQFCWKCGCISIKANYNNVWQEMKYLENTTFFKLGKKYVTDKISKHKYHHLYGKHGYLERFYHINKGSFLEIGFGCNMGYGAGHSANLWSDLFNNIHFIEYDGKCVEKYQSEIDNKPYKVHVGDQSDVIFLEKLKNKYFIDLGFDIIIDDGGHMNHHIISSFTSLWHLVNRDGLYFIEDFGESTYDKFYSDAQPITEWTKSGTEQAGSSGYFIKTLLENLYCRILTHKSCYDIRFIECTTNICVIGKVGDHIAIQ